MKRRKQPSTSYKEKNMVAPVEETIAKTTPVEEVSVPKATPKHRIRAIANCHGAPIIVARPSSPSSIRVAPIVFPAGRAIAVTDKSGENTVSHDEWDELKARNCGVRAYLSSGLLKEVSSPGEVDVRIIQSSNPQVPEHLQREEEVVGNTQRTAGVRRQNSSIITID
jgi:hypothetical protein